ncbi:hypothetical protein EPN96_04350 [bacterium]|nr:MAG: hypothetical protein EPN96_04350 [bacterium]
MKSPLKPFVSVAGFLSLCATAYLFVSIPAKAKPVEIKGAEAASVGSFHVHDRHGVEAGGAQPPHKENVRLRAFLNLHIKALDCSVCHLAASGASIIKLKDGKLALARGVEPLTENDPGVTKITLGKRCEECHKRGSPLLTGNYYGAKLRVLEDLSVFRYLEGN